MMHMFRGNIIIDPVAGGATPLSMDARIRHLITFPIQVIVARVPRRASTSAAVSNIRGGVQIVVVFSRKDIVPLGIIPAQSFLDPPKIAAGQIVGRGASPGVENNRDRHTVHPHGNIICGGRGVRRMTVNTALVALIIWAEGRRPMWSSTIMAKAAAGGLPPQRNLGP
jgi:hypothetical protein